VPVVILSGMKPDAKEIKKRIDLVEYIHSLGIDLKPVGAGEEYRGLCPFHEEAKPSFQVNRQKGLWHCFGCGAGGDVISFVMKWSKVGFQEALVILAGASIKKQGGLLEAVANYWHACLPNSASPRRYLERRGVETSELIERFRIGFAPGGAKTRKKLLSAGFTLEQIKAAGLINCRELDTFFGRVTFPLVERGKVINVYGRSLSNRYRHMYLPGRRDVIFSIENVAGDSAILTESIIDALSLMVLGFENAVSSLSVNLTARQIETLTKRFTRIVIVFDADAAGRRGASKTYVSLQDRGVATQIMELPDRSDINSLLMEETGSTVLKELLKEE
jgi:DNA primase